MTTEEWAQKFHDVSMIWMWVVLLIGWKFASSNQKHYLELGSEMSSVWNFCDRSSDLIIEGNLWWHHEMSAVFSPRGSNMKKISRLFVKKKKVGAHITPRR